jgi:hypothetical protein
LTFFPTCLDARVQQDNYDVKPKQRNY